MHPCARSNRTVIKKKKLARKTFLLTFIPSSFSCSFHRDNSSGFNAENFHLNYYFLAEFTMRFLWCSQHNSAFYCISLLLSDSVCGWNAGECLICIINLLHIFTLFAWCLAFSVRAYRVLRFWIFRLFIWARLWSSKKCSTKWHLLRRSPDCDESFHFLPSRQ